MSLGVSIKMWLVVSFLKAHPRCSVALKGIYRIYTILSKLLVTAESSDTNRGDGIRPKQDDMARLAALSAKLLVLWLLLYVSIIAVNDGHKWVCRTLWYYSEVNLRQFLDTSAFISFFLCDKSNLLWGHDQWKWCHSCPWFCSQSRDHSDLEHGSLTSKSLTLSSLKLSELIMIILITSTQHVVFISCC